MHTNCSTKVLTKKTECFSTKWAKYGGCIPAILENLERVSDLDEAFKPWELRLSNKERTIILKEQRVWQRALEIFDWFKRKGCYELNVIHYNIMIRILGKARRWEELETVREEMELNGIEAINSTYGTLIDVYSKGGVREKAMYWLDVMNKRRMEPDEVTMGIVVQMFKTAGQFEKAEEFFMRWSARKCVAEDVVVAVSNGTPTKDDALSSDAQGYFKKMQEASLEPDAVSYRTLLYAFSIRHMVCEAEELVNEMDKRDLEIDEFTQSSLTRMYLEVAYGINKKYDEACGLINSMDEHGVFPDKCSYNSLIQTLASADLPQKATFYLRRMQESGLVSDCIQYCAVISSFVKSGQLEVAVELFDEMVGFNLEPDVIVYGVLINAHADIGNVEEALHYVNEMKGRGLAMNGVICNTLIKLHTKVGCLRDAEDAYYLLQRLDVSGPDVYSSNCMIDLYTERSMVKPAEEIFDKLRRNGNANEFSYAMMLCMYKKIGSFEEAFEIAKQMRELGLLTDLLSHNHVLGLYASDGRFKEAVTIFKEMIELGVQPDDSTFKSLGVVLMKRGVPKKAVTRLEVMWRMDYESGLEAWLMTLSSIVGMVYHDISDV
uniref:Pentatricopeptide repeat-containing protein At3g23020 n=1 Tax=Tanacetum cinerariifolium TaxID=118510 RepID=A0A6L2KS12_TANCI|nr:hypothetical protein [Tanacetum cinerariifolium]